MDQYSAVYKPKDIQIKPHQISVLLQKETSKLFHIWVEADVIWHTTTHWDFCNVYWQTTTHEGYFNMYIETPTPMGTIKTCLLTHQQTWGLL